MEFLDERQYVARLSNQDHFLILDADSISDAIRLLVGSKYSWEHCTEEQANISLMEGTGNTAFLCVSNYQEFLSELESRLRSGYATSVCSEITIPEISSDREALSAYQKFLNQPYVKAVRKEMRDLYNRVMFTTKYRPVPSGLLVNHHYYSYGYAESRMKQGDDIARMGFEECGDKLKLLYITGRGVSGFVNLLNGNPLSGSLSKEFSVGWWSTTKAVNLENYYQFTQRLSTAYSPSVWGGFKDLVENWIAGHKV